MRVRFCPAGHDTSEVRRSPSNGRCMQCRREYDRRRYEEGMTWAQQNPNLAGLRQSIRRGAISMAHKVDEIARLEAILNQSPEGRALFASVFPPGTDYR